MLSHITKRNAVKAVAAVVANSVTCQITEEVIPSDNQYLSLGVGTGIYYSVLHPRLMNTIDYIADRRIARKAEKEATATA